ncbi:hypothetical protein [Pseudohoeflea coraliihabitans]|uniref:Uncharacterized protein n=1 Tax=Pseudohoeflea coraliihabitans TaxID=2860393 RepID=A0ABS6WTB1_9HYPH|nr:hypothetical protein [Pseudohoeflea sp. DP4N28-3]MBW3099193.1 hypothetical protein [Pseudohoeflea sp. DP4N28-3]
MATTSTSASTLPDYLKDPLKNAVGSAEDFLNSEDNYVYGSKPGESLYTGLTDQQNKAIGNADWLADQDMDQMFNLGEAEGLWRDYAGAGPATISGDFSGGQIDPLGRIVDEDGFLGSISSYMNPYLEQVLAPQMRVLNEQKERDRRTLGASAAMSGSFGDARHGISESMMRDDANRAAMEIAGATHADAWNQAMGLRSNDMGQEFQRLGTNLQSQNAGQDRALTTAINNQRAEQVANDAKGTAASALEGIGDSRFNLFSDINDALFNAGSILQQDKEGQRQAVEDFQKAISEKRYTDALRLIGVVQGVPHETKTTSTSESKSNSSGWGLAGSVLAGLFG